MWEVIGAVMIPILGLLCFVSGVSFGVNAVLNEEKELVTVWRLMPHRGILLDPNFATILLVLGLGNLIVVGVAT